MNPFSAFGKSPRLTRAFRPFAPRRGGSHLSFVPVCAGRLCESRVAASGMGLSRRVAFTLASSSSVFSSSRQLLPSFFVPPQPPSWSGAGLSPQRHGRAGHGLSLASPEGRLCMLLPRLPPQAGCPEGSADSPNFGCPELSGETVPDAEVACPANFRALRVPHRGVVLPFGQARRSLPSGRCSAFSAVACLPAASVCDGRLRLAVLGTCGGRLPSPPPLMGLCRIV